MIQKDKIRGALLGTGIGDALGMPIEGLSHQNVRTYYKGIKGFREDDQRGDLSAGQWTDDTQFTFAIARALADGADMPAFADRVTAEYLQLRAEARRWGPTTTAAIDRLANGEDGPSSGRAENPTNGAAMRAAPLGIWWAAEQPSREKAVEVIEQILSITHRHPCSLIAGIGQAYAVRETVSADKDTFDGRAFFGDMLEQTSRIEDRFDRADTRNSDRLRTLVQHLQEYPLDLAEICEGTGVSAHESWPYAIAMMARGPRLVEATLLSGLNVGGDADTTGAMMGALLGALNGWSAFPDEWRDGLEASDELLAQADELAAAVGSSS